MRRYPFSLAYSSFYEQRLAADKWLIAGYSFRNGCVDDLLARAWAVRRRMPSVMVVTKAEVPKEEDILDALGFDPIAAGDPDPASWLHTFRGGLEAAPQSAEWRRWTGASARCAAAS